MRYDSTAQKLYNRGKQARDNGDISGAKSLWKQAVAQEPNNAQFHASLANLYTKEGCFAEAVPCWREAVKHNPGDARFANGLGGALRHVKQYGEASSYFQKARELNPGNELYGQNLDECRAAQAALRDEGVQGSRGGAANAPHVSQAYKRPRAHNFVFPNAAGPAQTSPQPGAAPRPTPAPQPQPSAGFRADPAATSGAAPQAGARCNLPPDNRTKVFGLGGPYPYYDYPLERRGVPKHMFEADIKELVKLCKRVDTDVSMQTLACLMTGAMWLFVCCFMGCPGKKPAEAVNDKLHEMNQRYRQYGVTWELHYGCYGMGSISFTH